MVNIGEIPKEIKPYPKIEYGFCLCGCGQKTRVSTKTDRRAGHVRGEPFKYVHRHYRKPVGGHTLSAEAKARIGDKNRGARSAMWKGGRRQNVYGYVLVKADNHPFANCSGYVLEHRLIMEQILGRFLEREEVVHHKNGDKADNHPENLQLFANLYQHRVCHIALERAKNDVAYDDYKPAA